MDSDPDVEKDFPESDGEPDKVSKKELLIGRRKDKKDKKDKDRGYAALEGESSPEELDAKSPSKSKKSKAFKFTTSKSKEKREKSREKPDKESIVEEKPPREKEKPEKDSHKKKDKEKKEKEDKKKDKEKTKDKDKDKKEKKTKQPGGAISEEVLELGDVQPVFGVSVSLATERSRCHDGVDLPLVVRDCIDYLQENALKNEQIYKVEPVKTRLQHYKRLYNNRERQPDTDELDIPTACGLLKLFLSELPEPILTTDLIARFEEIASHPEVTKQQEELQQLLEHLPSCNKMMLSWILLHFDSVIRNEKANKTNAQSLAMLLSPPMQMSHRLLVAMLCHCPNLFAETQLIKYVPPITSTSPKLPESPEDIQTELRKQESLLAQIHAEMNAGFASKKREEQLWEVQRIITQLKRKLRSFEKKHDKSMDELHTSSQQDITSQQAESGLSTSTSLTGKPINSDDECTKTAIGAAQQDTTQTTTTAVVADAKQLTSQAENNADVTPIPPVAEECVTDSSHPTNTEQISPLAFGPNHPDGLYLDENSGLLMLPKSHVDYANLLRLQLENQELLAWKAELQARIGAERAEVLRLKQSHQQHTAKKSNPNGGSSGNEDSCGTGGADYEKIIENFVRENTLLEHKKQILAKEIFEERRECIALQVELALKQI